MRISDWSSAVCSSDLLAALGKIATLLGALGQAEHFLRAALAKGGDSRPVRRQLASVLEQQERLVEAEAMLAARSEEHTSELQSLMRISYAVFCLKKKKQTIKMTNKIIRNTTMNK